MKDYFDIQNDHFFDFLNQTFELKKCRTWEELSKKITIPKVKLTYKTFAKLFPRKFNYISELENLKSSFSSIHYGTLKANRIIDEVVRFSLYSDKIIVFHPLQNPSVTNHILDPRKNPHKWLPDFLDALYFYVVIQKWVKSGIVKLIINPTEYDLDLRGKLEKKTRDRVEKTDHDKFFDYSKDSMLNDLAEQFAIFSNNKDKNTIIQELMRIQQPTFTLEEAEKFAEKIITAIPRSNPIFNNIDRNIIGNRGMITPTKSGGSIESMLLISEITGGNIYTPSEITWYQMKEIGVNDFWLKTNKLYSQVPLNFLNSVDTSFALKLREDGRLEGVRQELKKIYNELGSIPINELNENKIKFLQEGFLEELKKSESEWNLIKKQADSSRKYWLSANVGIPIMTNEISIIPLVIGSLAWLYKNERDAKDKIELFKTKNSISVFVDLKNKKQNFFSELKNCLM